jgi:peptidoglycan/LPS O-acetylase OafA/YrhL
MAKTVETRRRRKWRGRTKLYALSALALVSAFLYWEQAALLYVASTAFICIVLIVVAFADLEGKDRQFSHTEGAESSEVPEQ